MSRYLFVFVTLVALTALTLGLSFAPLGAAGPPVALAIAVVKGALVALFFMHLTEQRTSNWVALVAAVLVATMLVVLAQLDVVTRSLAAD